MAAPFVAAPFTGGASLLGTLGMGAKTAGLIGAGLGAAGQLAGGAAAQRSSDRASQAEWDMLRAQMENNRIGTANQQALQFANARTGADQARMRQIGSADMLANSKPPTDPRTHMSGAGFMNPETIALMRERAMKALESGSDVPQMQQTSALPAQLPQGTGVDSFLRALNMGGTALGALQQAGMFQPKPVMPEVDPEQNAANRDRVNEIYGKVRFF